MSTAQTNRINDVIKKLYPKDFQPAKWKRFSFHFEDNKTIVMAVVAILLVHVALATFYYNKFIVLRTDVGAADAQIRTHLQKRGNIVTNLTKMVVDYAEHERTMYKYTMDVRTGLVAQTDMLLNAAKSIEKTEIDNKEFLKFEGLLSKFMAWSENYPDLKLNMNFQDFMKEIVAVETSIAEARIIFNTKVNAYMTYRMKFPNRIFADLFHFGPMEFYKGNEESQKFKEVDY